MTKDCQFMQSWIMESYLKKDFPFKMITTSTIIISCGNYMVLFNRLTYEKVLVTENWTHEDLEKISRCGIFGDERLYYRKSMTVNVNNSLFLCKRYSSIYI